jgi:hypothetical protein
MTWFYVLVGVLGTAVAVGELVSRYRDAPMRALATFPALIYIAINAGASLGALALIRAFDWKFGVNGTSSDAAVRWTQTLIAGFGALAFFRSSLFIVHVGDQDIGMGPSAFLQSVLDAADRGVDRTRANARSRLVGKVMKGLSFEKAHQSLPTYSLALMQNVPADVQVQIGGQVEKLRAATMPDPAKLLILGLLLMNELGGTVLESAVDGLREQIVDDPSGGQPASGGTQSGPPGPSGPKPPQPSSTAKLDETGDESADAQERLDDGRGEAARQPAAPERHGEPPLVPHPEPPLEPPAEGSKPSAGND